MMKFDDTILEKIALSIRSLSMDAIDRANSGHPGLPMGLAELGAVLYGAIMSYYPADPHWPNRDRFVLSAGHGSMLLYSLLHLSGYSLSIEDVKQFRQVGSRTPGHPEYGHTEGVETTTGPLGQGISNAIGMALAERFLAATYNTEKYKIIDHYTYVIASDGDMMEGLASEASSFAGHQKLEKLIVFYDDNQISIEGSTALAFGENVGKRYEGYGWDVYSADAYDWKGLLSCVEKAKRTALPSLIRVRSIIGKGSPNKEGTAGIHGSPLGGDDLRAAKRNLGLDENTKFYIDPLAQQFFAELRAQSRERYEAWHHLFSEWEKANPRLAVQWKEWRKAPAAQSTQLEKGAPQYSVGDAVATRSASGAMLKNVVQVYPNLIGGSADLAPSNNTGFPEGGDLSADNHAGRTIHFGVREHGMASICNGIAIYGGVRPFCATFLVFSDYMRGAMRLSALMGIPVIYVLTHDSIYVGEDGPTHQPIEHLAALRTIINMEVVRPGDGEETNAAWMLALSNRKTPTALVLTRQKLKVYKKDSSDWVEQIMKTGAYVVQEASKDLKLTIIATGSEVNMALEAANQLDGAQNHIRVVSMISRDRFMAQSKEVQRKIVPHDTHAIVVEAGISQGWEGFAAPEDLWTIDRYGASGPGDAVAESIGFTVQKLAAHLKAHKALINI